MRQISSVVQNLLRDNAKMRNNDRLLILTVWENYGFKLTDEQRQKFWDLPSAETIRRIRQKLQEKGDYPADASVARVRRHRSMVMQQNMPTSKPERIQQLMSDVW